MGERIIVDSARLPRAAAEWVLARLESPASRLTLGLAGGSTPRRMYETLSTELAHRVPWERLEFFFGDERCVPPTDEESNFRMAEEALFRGHLVDVTRVHRMRGEDPDAARAAADYEALLPPALDLLLLGVGPDGHTCSLFPGHPETGERTRRVVAVDGAPKPPPRRITITPPVIESARAVLVVAAGKDKAEAVARALEGPLDVAACPAQLARRGSWILDRAAASLLAAK
jgi:6-phosphogluconolactonase